jgi:hypothetical protein
MAKKKKKTPALERFGLWVFDQLGKRRPIDRVDDQVHILDKKEKAKIRRVQWGAIIRVSIAGAISAMVSAIANYHAYYLIDDEVKAVITLQDQIDYWVIVGGITVAVTILEIIYIYFEALYAVYRISVVAGLPLFGEGDERSEVATVLARAALEMPNPIESQFDIDPKKEMPRWRKYLAPIVYKLKIALSNFIAKMIIRRAMGRAVSKVYLEFVAIPVSALWNGIVCWYVLKQAKVRAMGPSFAAESADHIISRHPTISQRGKETMVRAIGSAVVRTGDFHPNLYFLLLHLYDRFEVDELKNIDNVDLFFSELKELPKEEQEVVVNTVILSSIIDGRISRKERKLLEEVFAICRLKFDHKTIKTDMKAFLKGEAFIETNE